MGPAELPNEPAVSSFYGPGVFYGWLFLMGSFILKDLKVKRETQTRIDMPGTNWRSERYYITDDLEEPYLPAWEELRTKDFREWMQLFKVNLDMFGIWLYPVVALGDFVGRVWMGDLEAAAGAAEAVEVAVSVLWSYWIFFMLREYLQLLQMHSRVVPVERYALAIFRGWQWRYARAVFRVSVTLFLLSVVARVGKRAFASSSDAGSGFKFRHLDYLCLLSATLHLGFVVTAGLSYGLILCFQSRNRILSRFSALVEYPEHLAETTIAMLAESVFHVLFNDFKANKSYDDIQTQLYISSLTLAPAVCIFYSIPSTPYTLSELDQATSLLVGVVAFAVQLYQLSIMKPVFGYPTITRSEDVEGGEGTKVFDSEERRDLGHYLRSVSSALQIDRFRPQTVASSYSRIDESN